MLKNILKFILQAYLKIIAKICLLIHRPIIIAIAGSANKTFFKNKIYNVLKAQKFQVRQTVNNFNTEIGLPLSILNLPSGYNSYRQWIPIIFKSFFCIFKSDYPQFLILEVGVSDPGDMKYLLSIIKPRISVITDITKRYLSAFGEIQKVVDEYKYLLKKTDNRGLAILNFDNEQVNSLGSTFKGSVKYFGIKDGADYQAQNIESDLKGQKFTIKNYNIAKEIMIAERGLHQVYATIASIIVQEYVSQNKAD